MKKTKNRLESFIDSYTNIVFIILSLAVFIMFALVLMQVLFRYIFRIPLFWIEEIARFLLIFIAILGGVLAIKEDIHPKVIIFYNRIKTATRMKWELFLRLFIIIYLFILTYEGWHWANKNNIFMTPGLRISYYWPLVIIPIGAVANLIILLSDSLNILLFKRSYVIKEKEDVEDKNIL